MPEAPGWKSGECKPRSENVVPDVFDSRNMLAIGRGTQYADMVALVAEALKTADPRANTTALRAHLLTQLKTTYAAGRGAFRGSFENWSFRAGSRAADRTPFIVMRPNGLGASQLAPLQFVRLRTDKLRPIDTLYLDIDLIRTFRVDDNDKSFFADFYLSMRGNNASIDKIEFANGFLDPKTNDRQITVRKLHEAGPSDIYPGADEHLSRLREIRVRTSPRELPVRHPALCHQHPAQVQRGPLHGPRVRIPFSIRAGSSWSRVSASDAAPARTTRPSTTRGSTAGSVIGQAPAGPAHSSCRRRGTAASACGRAAARPARGTARCR